MAYLPFLFFSALTYIFAVRYKYIEQFNIPELLVVCLVVACFYLQYDRLDFYPVFYGNYRGTSRGFQVHAVDMFCALIAAYGLGWRLEEIRARLRTGTLTFTMVSLLVFAGFTMASGFYAEHFLASSFVLWDIIRIASWMFVLFVVVPAITKNLLEIFFLANIMVAFNYLAYGTLQRILHGFDRAYSFSMHSNELGMLGLCLLCTCLAGAMYFDKSNLKRLSMVGAFAAFGDIGISVSRVSSIIALLVILGFGIFAYKNRAETFMTETKAVLKGIGPYLLLALILGGAILGKNYYDRFASEPFSKELAYGEGDKLGRAFFWDSSIEAAKQTDGIGVGLNNYSWWASREYAGKIGMPIVPYTKWSELRSDYFVINEEERRRISSETRVSPAHTLWMLTLAESGVWAFFFLCLLFVVHCTQTYSASKEQVGRKKILAFYSFMMVVAIALQSFTEWTIRSNPMLIQFLIAVKIGSDQVIARLNLFGRRAA